jgi:urease gamma subunit
MIDFQYLKKSVLNERKLTPSELNKREEVANAIERKYPQMPMDKKMAIATSTAKRVSEDHLPKGTKIKDGEEELTIKKSIGKEHYLVKAKEPVKEAECKMDWKSYIKTRKRDESYSGGRPPGKKKTFNELTELDFQTIIEQCLLNVLENIKHQNQKVLDKNNNGKIDKEDFELLRSGKKTMVKENEMDLVEELIQEISTELLARYKTKAAAAASEADAKGDFKTGDKRFSGIVKATKKQFDNETKKTVKEDTLEESTSVDTYTKFITRSK